MECVQFKYEKKYIDDFINLARRLYGKNNMEDATDIRNMLLDKHVLSKYFHLDKFLIYDHKHVVGRFAIVTYTDDDKAYLGFYECIDDNAVAAFIFDKVSRMAMDMGYKSITGPVDGSFWNKYRLKINMFDRSPYTGEPYNKEYYYKQFLDNGFTVAEHYTSNIYKTFDKEYKNEKYIKRYQDFIDRGYEIKNLDINDFDKVINELYDLLTQLYSEFPMYKDISKEDFVNVFSSYKMILNTSMVQFAYYKGKMAGFFISIPDYGNAVYNLNIFKILKVLSLKKKPKQYVMLYMGVDNKHVGLGSAFSQSAIREMQKNGLVAIGALCRDGKISQGYARESISVKYEYVLLKKDL